MTSESVVARHHAASSRATPARVLHAEERLRITCTVPPAPPAIRLLGEIDASNTAALARTLAHPPAAPARAGSRCPFTSPT
ncbi:hypothetical protein [Thermocatellispora tengchongensis]|uniref:hypothetical protein n=1 Tax=Thermocatellispora tengchongensis TaxID=1073253 RepID=UPI00364091E8